MQLGGKTMAAQIALKIQLLREARRSCRATRPRVRRGSICTPPWKRPRRCSRASAPRSPRASRSRFRPGYEGQVRARSGLASKHGIALVNAPGTVDEDYRGEVHVLLVNLGQEPYTIQPKDRIAQLVVAPVTRVALAQVGSIGRLSSERAPSAEAGWLAAATGR